ncbi:hypothetical protein [Halorussus aquaticus]|uniref:Small CPxCG-related zinc finger protein n=1 Tax=Halorussus aquaticus TaxID=2953748 RepID=A0ABD5Q108_9EURY|nr:hypothetical protein [Halorussus aquaticus]
MMVEHRFECVHCDHRVHATGEDSDAARQRARERGADHVNDDHADRLARSVHWPDELPAEELLTGEAAYGSLRGWLVPADDLLVCADCGYYFGRETPERAPVGDAGLVCTVCYQRRVENRQNSVTDAIEDFLR